MENSLIVRYYLDQETKNNKIHLMFELGQVILLGSHPEPCISPMMEGLGIRVIKNKIFALEYSQLLNYPI